jgi:type IV pilus assembly protein PilQ
MWPTQRHLKRIGIFQMGLMALVFFAFGCAGPTPAPDVSEQAAVERAPAEIRQLSEIRVEDQDGFLDIVIVGSDAMSYTAFKAIDPLRLVVDLPNTVGETISSPIAVENEIIGKIETVELPGAPVPMTRVEIGLNLEVPYEISQQQNEIRLQFEKPAVLAEQPMAEVAEEVTVGEQAAAAVMLPPAEKIIDIQPVTLDQELKVYVLADGRLDDYNAFPLTDPPRLVLDLPGVESALDKPTIPVSHPLVNRIRVGAHTDKIRVVFDLIPEAGLPYRLTPGEDRLVVSFRQGTQFSDESATAEVAVEKTVAPEAAAVVPTVEPAPAVGPAGISSVDFTLLDSDKSRLTIAADRPVEPEVQITSANSISIIFPNTRIPKHLQRHIDTGQFASAVNLIDPRPMRGAPNTAEFHIELREMVPYHLARDGDRVYVEFDSSVLPPAEPIALAAPVAVAEARAPEAAAPTPGVVAEAVEIEEPAAAVAAEAETPEVAVAAELEETMEPAFEEVTPTIAEAPIVAPAQRYSGQKISLDLQDVDVRNVLRLLADVTGKNMVVEPNVKGTVTLKVDQVPWDQVLDLILRINDLGSVIEGNVIRVATRQKIQAEMDRRRAEVEAEKELMAAARDVGEITTEYLQVNYADVNDIASQFDQIKSEKGTISIDPRTNLIIFSDFPKRIETARDILVRLDKATQQVMIEARIVTASTNFSRNLGISWNGRYTVNSLANRDVTRLEIPWTVSAPVSAVGTLGPMGFTRSATNILNIDMTLTALEAAGEGRVISSPRIFTLDHVQAMIQQGDQIPYPQRTEEGTISTAFAPATLSLTVTPHITPDGKVRMEVSAKKDEADFGRTVNEVPAIRTQEAQTELLVNDGDTVVIGGVIIQDRSWSESRVPGLWRVPVLGWLFKNRQVEDTKSELLIFLSPSIVKDEPMARRR